MARESWYDFSKGMGILLVLIGHWFADCSALHKVIYSFHMPFFFVVAGLQIDRLFARTLIDTVQGLFVKTGIPFVFFLFLGAMIIVCCGGSISCLRHGLLEGHPDANGPLWFLVVFAVANLLVVAVQRLGLNAWISALVFGAVFLVWNLMFPSAMIGLPATMGSWIPAAFFVCLGWLLSHWIRGRHGWSAELISGCLLVLCGLIALHVPVSYMAIGSFPNGGAFLLTGVMGSIGMLLVCRRITGVMGGAAVRFVGANSLYYFCMDRALHPVWKCLSIDRVPWGFVLHLIVLSALAVPLRIFLGAVIQFLKCLKEEGNVFSKEIVNAIKGMTAPVFFVGWSFF